MWGYVYMCIIAENICNRSRFTLLFNFWQWFFELDNPTSMYLGQKRWWLLLMDISRSSACCNKNLFFSQFSLILFTKDFYDLQVNYYYQQKSAVWMLPGWFINKATQNIIRDSVWNNFKNEIIFISMESL